MRTMQQEIAAIRTTLPRGEARVQAILALYKQWRTQPLDAAPDDPPPRPAQEVVLFQKGDEAVPTFEELVLNNRQAGHNADTAYTLAAKQNPESYENYIRGFRKQRVTKGIDQPEEQVQVTHPPGVAKSADGAPKDWAAQCAYWKAHPGMYDQYRAHFARQR